MPSARCAFALILFSWLTAYIRVGVLRFALTFALRCLACGHADHGARGAQESNMMLCGASLWCGLLCVVLIRLTLLFVALPFFVLSIESSATELDSKLEEASLNLGATPTRTFFMITLPMLRSSILAGVALSWARALGEFGATITFAGDNPGQTRTLPLQLFVALETNPERAMVIGMLMVVISLFVLVTLRGNWLGRR